MFLRYATRIKNGKEHRYYSIVENKRCVGDRIVQRQVAYLGQLDDQQLAHWQSTPQFGDPSSVPPPAPELFPTPTPTLATSGPNPVRFDLSQMQLRRPRHWGDCWLFCHLYAELGLDRFWADRLPPPPQSTRSRFFLHNPSAQPQRHALGFDPSNPLRLSPAGPGQRVAAAPALVRAERAGRFAGRGFFPGGDSSALRLPRLALAAQDRPLRPSHGAVEGFVQRPIRRAALRPDQHLFRERAAFSARRQTEIRSQPRQA